jgi:hypothetical protein
MRKNEKEIFDAYMKAHAEAVNAYVVLNANREKVIGILKANGNFYQNEGIGFLSLSESETRYFDNAFIGKIPSDWLAEVVTVAVDKAERVMDISGYVTTKTIQKISFKAAV